MIFGSQKYLIWSRSRRSAPPKVSIWINNFLNFTSLSIIIVFIQKLYKCPSSSNAIVVYCQRFANPNPCQVC